MNGIIDTLRTSGLSGWVAFAVIYHFGTGGAWRRSRVGPWIMSLCVVPMLTLLTGLAAQGLGREHLITACLRLVLMLIINVMPLWLAVLFIRRQREIGGTDHGETQPLHEGDSGGGQRRLRPVPAGDDSEQRSG